ncbi:MAG: RluA family pseudouridine synthase [Actinobacteria bacterium]|nr:RluA family pseudouridine synthase [Actinomycetota bacterium]
MAALRFRVPEADRLDRAVAARPEVGSRGLAERLILAGAVLVDGEPRPKSFRLEGGEEIAVELPDAEEPLQAEEMDLRVAWEDEHLLVVDKPAGLVVHPGVGHATGTLVHGLLALDAAGGDEERPGIVHRLDRDTSGLLVVARSDEAHERLQEAIRRREVERRYLALVRGKPKSRTGRIEAPIGRDRSERTRHSLDTPTPRDAVTFFEIVELLPEHTLLDVKLETGRTHQIRVHLEAIDLPVAGDPVYGAVGDLGLERQFLHAARLSFTHPFTGERIEAESPLPEDLAAALERARTG